jgi:hypothetical protein
MFLVAKGRRRIRLIATRPTMSRLARKRTILDVSQSYWPPRPVAEVALPSPLRLNLVPGLDLCTAFVSSGQSSWLQIQRSGFDSRCYQILWEVVGLERGSLSLGSTIEELLERKSSDSGLEMWEYTCRDPSRWPRGTLYPEKLTLTAPTSGEVRSRTQATEFFYWTFVAYKETLSCLLLQDDSSHAKCKWPGVLTFLTFRIAVLYVAAGSEILWSKGNKKKLNLNHRHIHCYFATVPWLAVLKAFYFDHEEPEVQPWMLRKLFRSTYEYIH